VSHGVITSATHTMSRLKNVKAKKERKKKKQEINKRFQRRAFLRI
jgi:hypothetical protein